ncbi:hypothetical protein SAMD00023353_4900330 [Rosellinia necatrix]|uniref:Uncharacterized protein n=1 Tax=Rosellinia necatrix TaxID=77044 RepID=A0A1S8A9T4_ROSNE|nr:hypothetical protein SAMD00023353_4900330 [Rosellinia necatrix]
MSDKASFGLGGVYLLRPAVGSGVGLTNRMKDQTVLLANARQRDLSPASHLRWTADNNTRDSCAN